MFGAQTHYTQHRLRTGAVFEIPWILVLIVLGLLPEVQSEKYK